VIDEAGARARLAAQVPPPEVAELKVQLDANVFEKETAVRDQNFEKAAALRDRERELQGEIRQKQDEWEKRRQSYRPVLGEEEIAFIVSRWTGIPVARLQEAETARLLRMEEELHATVVGQDEAIHALARSIRRSRAGLKDPKRPIGSFIFAGPTGVGKTLLAKRLAHFMFGDENALVQIDMSEYMEKHNVSRLIGAPPGYIGYEEGGQLTEKIRRRPYSVVLLDEIEKAHPDVWNMLLQIMEEGRLTDNVGRVIDFKNTILIMTTNIGAQEIVGKMSYGFAKRDDNSNYQKMKDTLKQAMEANFRPEFLNRVDDVIVFRSLQTEDLKRIIDIELSKVFKRLKEKNLTLVMTDEAKELLIAKGTNTEYGARPLRRAIEHFLEDPLSEDLLRGAFVGKDTITVRVAEVDGEKKLVFETTQGAPPPHEMATAIKAV
jgi:ATP-dependent Clp protease ATP-binding subunit ClpC